MLYREGATHGIFGPLDIIARLAALVTKPRVNGLYPPMSLEGGKRCGAISVKI